MLITSGEAWSKEGTGGVQLIVTSAPTVEARLSTQLLRLNGNGEAEKIPIWGLPISIRYGVCNLWEFTYDISRNYYLLLQLWYKLRGLSVEGMKVYCGFTSSHLFLFLFLIESSTSTLELLQLESL